MQVTQENLKQNFLLKLPLTIIAHISPSALLSLSPSLSTKIYQTIIVSQGKWTSGIISTDHFKTSSWSRAFNQTRSIVEMSVATVPDFFDESYFFEDCFCEIEGKKCEFHENQGLKVTESANLGVQQVEINQSFPRRPIHEELVSMIEYRIKILLNYDEILKPGQTKEVQTNLTVKRKCGNLSLLILSADLKTTRFCSEGFLSPNMRGRLTVTLNNPQSSDVYLAAGTIVSFLVLAPFVN